MRGSRECGSGRERTCCSSVARSAAQRTACGVRPSAALRRRAAGPRSPRGLRPTIVVEWTLHVQKRLLWARASPYAETRAGAGSLVLDSLSCGRVHHGPRGSEILRDATSQRPRQVTDLEPEVKRPRTTRRGISDGYVPLHHTYQCEEQSHKAVKGSASSKQWGQQKSEKPL